MFEEMLVRKDPTIQNIIEQNNRRKKIMAKTTRASIERTMMARPFSGGGNFVYSLEEAVPGMPDEFYNRPNKYIYNIEEIVKAEKEELIEQKKSLSKTIRKIWPASAKETLQDDMIDIDNQIRAKDEILKKYRKVTEDLPIKMGPIERDISTRSEQKIVDAKEQSRKFRSRQATDYYKKIEDVEEIPEKRPAQKVRVRNPYTGKMELKFPGKVIPPITTMDLSGAKIKELTAKEIADQVSPYKGAANRPDTFTRIEGRRTGIAGRKEFMVFVDDIEDPKLSKSVIKILEKNPKTLIEVDKTTGKIITKEFIKVGSKQVPIEVFREAYRSLPKEKAVGIAKVLAKVGTRFLGPLGVAITIADVVGLLAKAQAKET